MFDKPTKTIRKGAFSACSGLTSLTIPDTVTEIGDRAFNSCRGLTSVTMPDSGITVGESAFSMCNNLITSPDDRGLIQYVKCNDNPYFLLQYCKASADYVINENTKIIGDKAFLEGGIRSVTMPNGLTTIGNQAFSGCYILNNVVIPQSVTLIGEGAFSGTAMHGLYTITLPFIGATPNDTTNTYIGYLGGESSFIEHDFQTSKPALTNVTISSSNPITIGDYAFCNTWLTKLTLNCEVTQIGDYAFARCKLLTDITFNGTKEEWNAVINNKKIWGDSDKPSSTKVTIHCSDGNIVYSK